MSNDKSPNTMYLVELIDPDTPGNFKVLGVWETEELLTDYLSSRGTLEVEEKTNLGAKYFHLTETTVQGIVESTLIVTPVSVHRSPAASAAEVSEEPERIMYTGFGEA